MRLLDAYEQAQKSGKGVFIFEDELVDIYQVKWARRQITLYDKYKELGQESFV